MKYPVVSAFLIMMVSACGGGGGVHRLPPTHQHQRQSPVVSPHQPHSLIPPVTGPKWCYKSSQ